MVYFSTFWLFSVKPVDAEHVLRAETMVLDAGDCIGARDSKTVRNSALFSSPVAGGCDELSIVGVATGWKRTSFGVSGIT